MNTTKIWQSTGTQKKVLKETGYSRMEISYIFKSREAFAEFMQPGFIALAQRHMEGVLLALNYADGCRARLPQLRLLECFLDLAKRK
jgi:hypothetical protein